MLTCTLTRVYAHNEIEPVQVDGINMHYRTEIWKLELSCSDGNNKKVTYIGRHCAVCTQL